jgi:hypothetical protein
MKIIIISILFITSIWSAAAIDKKWETNENCEACHMEISAKWETSRHANSHFSKNDLYKKSLMYMVRQNNTLIMDEVKVDCAKCHNPRIMKSEVGNEDKVSLLLEDKNTTKAFKNALNSENMKNGINCVVCHNVDEIHLDKEVGSTGMNNIKFGPQGTMFGPFDDANSPYHKTVQRDHFTNDDPTLCFACHYGAKNHQGLEVYATGKEYDKFAIDSGGKVEGCKSCHMSSKKKGVASNYAKVGEKPKERMVRAHRFASVDNSNILIDHIDVKSATENGKFVISIKNNTPHKIPTGYGLREIILNVVYLDKNDKEIGSKKYVLGAKWEDAQGKATIPHLAEKMTKDTRQEGKTTKVYKFPIPAGAVYAKYSFSYRLISEEMGKKIDVTDPFFLKEYIFSEQRVYL